MNQQTIVLGLFIALGAGTVTALSMIKTQAHAQVMESAEPGTENSVSNQGLQPKSTPDTSLSNSGIPKEEPDNNDIVLEDDQVAFRFRMENGVVGNTYRLCASVTGEIIENMGCDQKQYTAEDDTGDGSIGHIWVFSLSGKIKNSMLYGCAIGDNEKKVSCNITSLPTPPAEQVLNLDWSESSPMDMPATFRPYVSSEDDIRQQAASQQQQQKEEGNNNEDEDEEEEGK